jgi:hypothetical protein
MAESTEFIIEISTNIPAKKGKTVQENILEKQIMK